MIQFLAHTQIDKERWDACIREAPNGLIYGFSWYLDTVCPGWHALVWGDYLAVMPLPVRKRFGIDYVYAPFYAQQLGVFGTSVDENRVGEFIRHIPPVYKLIDIKFNEGNTFPEGNLKVLGRKNFLLKMAPDYAAILSGYHRNCRRNIRKALESGLQSGGPIEADSFAAFIRDNLKDQMKGLDSGAVDLLERITSACLQRGLGEINTVRNAAGDLCAAGSFLFHRKRLIFSVCASTSEGKQNQAMYLLVDQTLQKHAGQYEEFDFSGSEIKGIAYFNSTFGAEPKRYSLVHINRLNWLQRIISGKIR